MENKRNIEPNSRKESHRPKKTKSIRDIELVEIKKHYNSSIEDITKKFDIANSLKAKSDIDSCKDIWRSQIVFLESAFDYFMHQVSKYAMCQMHRKNWQKTEKYYEFNIKLITVEQAIKEPENDKWLMEAIIQESKKYTSMGFGSIKYQCDLMGINIQDIANNVYNEEGTKEENTNKLKSKATELFNRRNCIAHQSDRLHENGEKQDITETEVQDYIDFINNIVNAILDQIAERNKKS